jgi:hypothetical protein
MNTLIFTQSLLTATGRLSVFNWDCASRWSESTRVWFDTPVLHAFTAS